MNDLYAVMTHQWYTGTPATNQIKYGISTAAGTPDLNALFRGYCTPYFNPGT